MNPGRTAAPPTAAAEHNAADVMFAQMMIPHHAQAVEMSDGDMKKLDAAQGTEAAKLFLTQMIAHHEGAIVMAKTETTGGKNPEAINLGKAIVTAQEAEIQEMQALLAKL